MPQAASAHDTFWDFISLMPESMHMIMWVMSDRAIPRSFRMMEGFGVHTFRFVNDAGQVALREVPLEAAARRALGGLGRGAEDLRQGPGLPPPRPLGGDRERRLSRVGARRPDRRGGGRARRSTSTCSIRPRSFRRSSCRCERVGRLTLNRNPDNFFAETEQVAFHPGHVVPGHRLHQRSAAAGPALLLHRHAADPPRRAELPRDPDQPPGRAGAQQPARRPHAPDDQPRPGELRAQLARRRLPDAGAARRRAASSRSAERIDGAKVRARGEKLLRSLQPGDAVLQQPVGAGEGAHRRGACGSSSARSRRPTIRERMVGMLGAGRRGRWPTRVAEGLGFRDPRGSWSAAQSRASPPTATRPTSSTASSRDRGLSSPALSMADPSGHDRRRGRSRSSRADGVDARRWPRIRKALRRRGRARRDRRAPGSARRDDDGDALRVDFSLLTAASVLFDAVYVPGGEKRGALADEARRGRLRRARPTGTARRSPRPARASSCCGRGRIPVARPMMPEPADDATIVGPTLTTALARRLYRGNGDASAVDSGAGATPAREVTP